MAVTVILTVKYIHHKENGSSQYLKKNKLGIGFIDFSSITELSDELR